MRGQVYIETSFISYVVGRLSRDLLVAAHQQISREWWEDHRPSFDIFISQLVLDEAKRGDQVVAKARLAQLQGIPLLEVTEEALSFAEELLQRRILNRGHFDDALHISVATIHGLDFLLTWNCKHIANAKIQSRILKVANELELVLPTICTPLELMED